VDRAGFLELLVRLKAGWDGGDAAAVAACFVDAPEYVDPLRYRFDSRGALLPFFAPPPRGHSVTWHRVLFDPVSATGAAEYTYEGHHRYHGAVIVEVTPDGLIRGWREWQHVADDQDWATFVAGHG
jgi:hypothetical protein